MPLMGYRQWSDTCPAIQYILKATGEPVAVSHVVDTDRYPYYEAQPDEMCVGELGAFIRNDNYLDDRKFGEHGDA